MIIGVAGGGHQRAFLFTSAQAGFRRVAPAFQNSHLETVTL